MFNESLTMEANKTPKERKKKARKNTEKERRISYSL
jgi:hypothetical protein